MMLNYSADALALRDGAQAFLERSNPVERLRRDGDEPMMLWGELAAAGLLGVTADESVGGLGQSISSVMPICEAFGYSNLPEPAAETLCVTVPVLTACDCVDRVAQIVAGQRSVAVAHAANPVCSGAAGSDELLIVTPSLVALYERGAVGLEEIDSVDPWRHVHSIKELPESALMLARDAQAQEIYQRSLKLGALAAAAQLCGLAARMIELATVYAGEREQFGQAIGRFQAVKHMLATARVKVEFARPVVNRAGALAMDDGRQSEILAAHAKVAASDAAIAAGETAIQVFGGMGYTYEADLHYFMKRAWALSGAWGSREHHLNVLEQGLFKQQIAVGPEAGFGSLSNETETV